MIRKALKLNCKCGIAYFIVFDGKYAFMVFTSNYNLTICLQIDP